MLIHNCLSNPAYSQAKQGRIHNFFGNAECLFTVQWPLTDHMVQLIDTVCIQAASGRALEAVISQKNVGNEREYEVINFMHYI